MKTNEFAFNDFFLKTLQPIIQHVNIYLLATL